MNILVIGGAGYLGSVICTKLRQEGHNVTVIDNFLYQQWHIASYLASINIDVREYDITEQPYSNSIEKLFHFADIIIPLQAIVGMPACAKNPELTQKINTDSIKYIVDRISPSKILLGINTNSSYGITPEGQITDENSPVNPISLYAETKQKAEEYILNHKNSIVFRFATVYGLSPRLRLDLLVNQFCFEASRTKKLSVFEGNFRRNFIHINDVANLFSYVVDNPSKFTEKIYNVGNDEDNMTKYDLAQLVCEHNNAELTIDTSRQDVDKRDYCISNERLYKTGFKPVYTIKNEIPIISRFLKNNFKNMKNFYFFRNA